VRHRKFARGKKWLGLEQVWLESGIKAQKGAILLSWPFDGGDRGAGEKKFFHRNKDEECLSGALSRSLEKRNFLKG